MADRIVFCYTENQKKIEDLKKLIPQIELRKGFTPELYESHDPSKHMLLICDDLMNTDIYSHLSDLFTKISRHRNISVIWITQCAYFKGQPTAVRHNRDLLQNTTEVVLFRSPRDKITVLNIGRSSFPSNYKWFVDVYEDATKDRFGYLMLSFHPQARVELMLRTKIFYNIETPYLYLKR